MSYPTFYRHRTYSGRYSSIETVCTTVLSCFALLKHSINFVKLGYFEMKKLSITDDINEHLKQFGSYDDPYFMFIHCNADENCIRTAITSAFLEEHIRDVAIYTVDKKTHFTSLYSNTAQIEVMTEAIVESLANQNITARLSVFHHNSLGNTEETFHWGLQQLSHLIKEVGKKSGVAINDFTDRANWTGLDQYKQPVKENTLQNAWRSTLQLLRGFLSVSNSDKHSNIEAPFAIGDALLQLHPFITNLPSGDLLWQYVLTGEEKEQLKSQHAFIDLDGVLVLLHAKQHAPDFYQHTLNTLRFDSIPRQSEVANYLHRILEPLAEELLETQEPSSIHKDCYLRILDIFFHLFDQQPFSQKIYEQLTNDDAGGMSVSDYQQRYSVNHQTEVTELCETTKMQIIEILDDFDSYYSACNEQKREIERACGSNRLAYDHTQWENGGLSSLLLTALLLNLDKQNTIEDEKTKSLYNFFDEEIPKRTLQLLMSERYMTQGEVLPPALISWLQGDSSIQLQSFLPDLKNQLALSNWQSEHSSPQPHFELFSNISDFKIVLAACYWRRRVGDSDFSDRIIELALSLAPQATLSCFARLYKRGFREFASEELQHAFNESLVNLGVSAYDTIAYNIRYCSRFDSEKYESLVRQYVQLEQTEKQKWDSSLSRTLPITADYFYLNAYRLMPSNSDHLLVKRSQMLSEVADHLLLSDSEAFTAHLPSEQVLFSDHTEFLPAELDLPVTRHPDAKANREEFSFCVVRRCSEQYEVLVDSSDDSFDPKEQVWPSGSQSIIVDGNIDIPQLFALLENLPTEKDRTQRFSNAMTQFLAEKITFAEYQLQTQYDIDSKVFSLTIENYSEYNPRILPQILAEPDKMHQLRLIKLFSSHPRRGKKVQKNIAAELFFDQLLKEEIIDFQERRDIELEDLNSEGQKYWEQFQNELTQKMSAVA